MKVHFSLFSGEPNRPLPPILLKSIAIHLPLLSRCFCKSMPSSWQKACTPPVCITIRLPFVSRYFCRSIRVRGRWNTPPKIFKGGGRSISYFRRVAPVRFGCGLGVERFDRFRFSVPTVPLQKGFFSVSAQINMKGRFRFRFRFLENGSGGSSSAFGFGKNSRTNKRGF